MTMLRHELPAVVPRARLGAAAALTADFSFA